MPPYLPVCLLALLAPFAAYAVSVHDDLQRAVHLDRPATRIVTLAPHATELVIAAGAGDRLVGAPPGGGRTRHDRIADIGGPGPLDRERLLTLEPDLVVAWHSGNRAADLAWIARNGIALYLSEPAGLGDIADSIRAIGRLSARHADAAQHAAAFEAGVASPCAALPIVPVFVEIWDHPPMTVGGRHWLNDVLRAVGYRNVYADQARAVFAVSPEARLQYQAARRISLLPGRTGDTHRHSLGDLLSRPGPRLAEAVTRLCAQRRGRQQR